MKNEKTTKLTVGKLYSFEYRVGRFLPIKFASISNDYNPLYLESSVAKLLGYSDLPLQPLCLCEKLVDIMEKLFQDFTIKDLKINFFTPVIRNEVINFYFKIKKINDNSIELELFAKKEFEDTTILEGEARLRKI